jgi:Family of unknown function (DUF6502)
MPSSALWIAQQRLQANKKRVTIAHDKKINKFDHQTYCFLQKQGIDMKTDQAWLEGSPDVIFRALRRMLQPLVRFLVAKGITYPAFTDLIKSLYVQVALDDFALEKKPQTDSRITLLTGIQRREVKRISEHRARDNAAPPSVSFGAQIVARWISDKRFLDKRGKPVPLMRSINEGGDASFEALVASVSKDIRSRPVLDEWLRLGAAHLDEDNLVHLNATSFVPRKGFEEKIFYFGFNLHDHIAASVSNMLENAPPMLERSAYYDRLSAASVEQLRKLSTELGAHAIQKIVGTAMRLEAQDADQPNANHRMTFGVYFFTEPTRQSADVAEPEPTVSNKRGIKK